MRSRPLFDIFEEHLEELEILFNQRASNIYGSDWKLNDLIELENRLDAHLEGLPIDQDLTLSIIETNLSYNDITAYTAASILLKMNFEGVALQVFDSFKKATENCLYGIRDALCHGHIDYIAQQLHDLFSDGPLLLASAAGEVLAFHRQLNPYA